MRSLRAKSGLLRVPGYWGMPEVEKGQPASLSARILGCSEENRGPVERERQHRSSDRHPLTVSPLLSVESLSVNFFAPYVAVFRLGWISAEFKILAGPLV